MIQLQQLHKQFADRVLLDNVSWQVGDRDRVGLCGPNGAGKTTLLRMLAGLDEPDAGQALRPNALTVGYLPQDGIAHHGTTVFEEASLALAPLLAMRDELSQLEERLAEPGGEAEHEAWLIRYSDVQEHFRIRDGYQLDQKVATVLRGLGFPPEEFATLTDHLSGGWQMRVALAKLLLGQPDLLLLDEPTNHLDLEARNWLEDYLSNYPHSVILVSHDRYFLDAVVTRIADLSLRTITDYHCNYSQYLVQRDERLARLRAAKARQDEEVGRVQQFIDRFRYQATKAAQVQSRIKMLEKVERIEVPPERKRIHFQFPAAPKSGRIALELTHADKGYGSKHVLQDVTLHVERGDRIALVGHNGAGKSTLMRLLAGEEAPDSGERREGHQLVMQTFAQDEATRLDATLTVYETLSAGSPHAMVPAIRNILGGFLFSGDDVYKKVAVLSGGERTRLAVARMLLRPSNTLLLDEPTNHLDLDSKEVLLDALADYGGTLVFVSHDRYFVERLATRIVQVADGRATLYPGTYVEYLWSKAHGDPPAAAVTTAARRAQEPRADARAASASSSGAKSAGHLKSGDDAARRQASARATQAPVSTAVRHDAAEQRRRSKSRRTLQSRISELEARIADREGAIKQLEAQMSAPDFYQQRDRVQQSADQHQALMWEVGELLAQWEMLQAESSALETVEAK